MKSPLLTAFALMLLIEGLMPLLSPGGWRQTMQKVTELRDGQIRFIGAMAVLAGVVLLLIVGN